MLRLLAAIATGVVAALLMLPELLRSDAGAGFARGHDGPVPAARHSDQDGHVRVGPYRLTQSEIRQAVARGARDRRARFRTWDLFDYRPAAASARGTGGDDHFFVNSFLVGFRPFRVDSPALLRGVIARRKSYTRDHVQYDGLTDVWQTSRESWIAPRGDCEDHALLLADWLIERGMDARVVLGQARGEGHAWVVVIDGDTQYLIEATDKRRRRRALPRAALVGGYRPAYQFNRQRFWVNTGRPHSRDYAGEHWAMRSRFVRR